MLSAGSKRPAPDNLTGDADLAMARSAFNTAVRALVQVCSPDDLNNALTALGPHVNLRRIEGSGRLALHAALAKHVMPDRYPRLIDAVTDVCAGKHLRTAETHSAALSRLVKQLGGQQAITDALSQYAAGSDTASSSQPVTSAAMDVDSGGACALAAGSSAAAACSLVMLSDQLSEEVPHVSAVIGTTGQQDWPVALRLGLPAAGLLTADGVVSPPLSPPGLDTLELDDLVDELDNGIGLRAGQDEWCSSAWAMWIDSFTESAAGDRKRARMSCSPQLAALHECE